ncbi:MAG: hypothetical protein KJ718_05045 [Nanoarchaeota archaeon]|nr:hypothetical protein [Nanoarchaeota archaeon]
MIDERKLLCAFIYSAYDSGYCGLGLDDAARKEDMNLFKRFIEFGGEYPEERIRETQGKMTSEVDNSGIRDYIYRGHYEVVESRIVEATGKDFDDAVKEPMILHTALSCGINFYEVVSVGEQEIKARHLFSGLERNLVVLQGLQIPSLGDIVSGHWNYYLEISDVEQSKSAREFFERVKANFKS